MPAAGATASANVGPAWRWWAARPSGRWTAAGCTVVRPDRASAAARTASTERGQVEKGTAWSAAPAEVQHRRGLGARVRRCGAQYRSQKSGRFGLLGCRISSASLACQSRAGADGATESTRTTSPIASLVGGIAVDAVVVERNAVVAEVDVGKHEMRLDRERAPWHHVEGVEVGLGVAADGDQTQSQVRRPSSVSWERKT